MKTNNISNFSHFSGRIIQIMEVLDYGDAVSNHLLNIQKLLCELEIKNEIFTYHAHEQVYHLRKNLNALKADEHDIILYHYSGYAKYTADLVSNIKCTKVLIYHNITPKNYFKKNSLIFKQCHKARNQLQLILTKFHHYVAVSQFNLNELINLRASKNKTSILPIIVPYQQTENTIKQSSKITTWLFVGRISPNKQQHELVKQFKEYIDNYDNNQQLVLVGNYTDTPEYFTKITNLIKQLDLENKVTITGKISDKEVANHYKNADIFVCLSEHEGFGVPLIEACHYKLPVIALSSSAVTETLDNSPGLIQSAEELSKSINKTLSDLKFKQSILNHQALLKEKYSTLSVKKKLQELLQKLIPSVNHYKTISIVICTCNRGNELERCLDYLQYQTNPNFEVIVINGPSSDNTDEVLKNYQNKIKIANINIKNLSSARNLGIEMSSGDIIAFIDDDTILYFDWIEQQLKTFNSVPFAVGALGGSIFYAGTLEFQRQDIIFDRYARTINATPELAAQKNWHRSLPGIASFIPEHLKNINGFDEEYDYFLDETDLCFRMETMGKSLLMFKEDIYSRHEFAKSDNRKNTYNYNWFTICKNTAYFIFKSNPKQIIKNYLVTYQKAFKIRILPILRAYLNKAITIKEMQKYIFSIYSGTRQGIKDAKKPRKIRELHTKADKFKPYPLITTLAKINKTLKPLHVVLLANSFPLAKTGDDIGIIYHHLAGELLQMEHYVTVITNGKDFEYQRGRFKLYSLQAKQHMKDTPQAPHFIDKINWSITIAKKINELNEHHTIDIIDSPANTLETYAIYNSTNFKTPLILRYFNSSDTAKLNTLEKKLTRKAKEYLFDRATYICTLNNNVHKTLAPFNNKLIATNPGICYWPKLDVDKGYEDLAKIDKSFSINKNSYKLLYKYNNQNELKLVLTAFEYTLDNIKNLYLIVCTNKHQEFNKESLASYKNTTLKQVKFIEASDQYKLEKLYLFADIIIVANQSATFSISPLQAFVHGKPVIASNIEPNISIIHNNQCGLLFQPDNAQELSKHITTLLTNKETYFTFSNAAKQRIRQLSAFKMACSTIKLYHQATQETS